MTETKTEPAIMKRRQFVKSAALTGAGALILPRIKLFGARRSGNKLNIGPSARGVAAKRTSVRFPAKTSWRFAT
jgi:hypothetical protein